MCYNILDPLYLSNSAPQGCVLSSSSIQCASTTEFWEWQCSACNFYEIQLQLQKYYNYITPLTFSLHEQCSHITLNLLYWYFVHIYCTVFYCTILYSVGCAVLYMTIHHKEFLVHTVLYLANSFLICYIKSYLQQLLICKGHDSFKYNDTGTIHSFLEEETNNHSIVSCVNLLHHMIY